MARGGIGALLKSDKVPFFLSALFGALGWALVHIVGSVLETPTIEYRPLTSQQISEGVQLVPCEPRSEHADPKSKITGYEVTNISRTALFKAIKFVMVPPDGRSRILAAGLVAFPPIHLDRNAEQPTCGSDFAEFPIPELHPGWRFGLLTRVDGAARPELRFAASDQAVRLQEPSAETCFVRHETGIILTLIVGWMTLMTIYILYLKG